MRAPGGNERPSCTRDRLTDRWFAREPKCHSYRTLGGAQCLRHSTRLAHGERAARHRCTRMAAGSNCCLHAFNGSSAWCQLMHRPAAAMHSTGMRITRGRSSFPSGTRSFPHGKSDFPRGRHAFPRRRSCCPRGRQGVPRGRSHFPRGSENFAGRHAHLPSRRNMYTTPHRLFTRFYQSEQIQ